VPDGKEKSLMLVVYATDFLRGPSILRFATSYPNDFQAASNWLL
jgi:hypothetical protein